jgi:hypothetical protein
VRDPDNGTPPREAGVVPLTDPVPTDLEFTCPRCRRSVTESYYGPCETCRGTLRAELGGEAREIQSADYVPKMNVTPNAVATKD